MNRRRRHQGGFTLIPSLALLAILMMLGAAFLQGVFKFQAIKTRHEERTMTASAVAEAGVQRALSELTAGSGNPASTFFNNTQHMATQVAVSDPVTGEVIGSFDATYEDGALIGSATATGSATAGTDKWGNPIWYDATNKNYVPASRLLRFGVRVDGYATYPDGQRKPGGQAIYVRAIMNSPSTLTTTMVPADYVLFSNGDMTINNNSLLDGGLTHTNGALSFRWQTYSPSAWQHSLTESTKIYSPLSYVTALNYLYYHAHAYAGAISHVHDGVTNSGTRPWSKNMIGIAAISQPTPAQYTNSHQHTITDASAISSILSDTAFFNWGSPASSFYATTATAKAFPTLSLNELLRLTKPAGGTTNDLANGYVVGNADFRATYFGRNLRYTGDSGTPAVPSDTGGIPTMIYVNTNAASTDNMKIKRVTGPAPTDYQAYTYREIPPNGVILVRDGQVMIGNYTPISPATGTGPEGATTVPGFGPSTIIDGRLTIVSYTDSAAAIPGPGDITVCGNVVYRNKVYVLPGSGARQYDPGDSAATSLTDTKNWVTNLNGLPATTTVSGEQVPTGRVCALGLFASNNVNINLRPYLYNAETASGPNDILRIMGQILAGANPTISATTKSADSVNYRLRQVLPASSTVTASDWDKLKIYGSVSTFNSPMTSYFNSRDYIYDKTLKAMPLGGQPYISPAATFTNIPMIIPGSWTQVPGA
ncbi:MAG: hypothetical protein H7338_03205 [Candidatus Sericytochromatia bacterium]|nr:hypothetical protein [Candidatus Sericytochromatia bacterium]